MEELLGLYDENYNECGYIERSKKNTVTDGKKFHIVLVFLRNSEGKYLFQKVSKEKGGSYAVTGGHVTYKNTPLQTALKEVEEELGIKLNKIDFFKTYEYDKAYQSVYFANINKNLDEFTLQKSEVEKLFWLNKSQIRNLFLENLIRKGNIKAIKEIVF